MKNQAGASLAAVLGPADVMLWCGLRRMGVVRIWGELWGDRLVTGLKIAVAGGGLIGQRHLELVDQSDACDLCGIVEPGDHGQDLGRRFGAPVFADLAELLAAAIADGVVIATPTPLHVAHCLACVTAGVPALVEKPVASTTTEAQELRDAVNGSGVPVLVGHHRLHSSILRAVVGAIAAGEIGDVVAITGSAMFYKPDGYFAAAPWRSEPGGGPILINLIHDIGNLRALGGEIAAVQAFASQQARGGAVEDTVAISLRFSSGALGTFMLCDTAAAPWSWEQTTRENPYYAAIDGEDCYHVAGTQGSIAVPTLRQRTYGADVERSWAEPFDTTTIEATRDDPLACQLAHFCDVVRRAAAPLVTVQDGLNNLRVAEAVAVSATDGGVVKI